MSGFDWYSLPQSLVLNKTLAYNLSNFLSLHYNTSFDNLTRLTAAAWEGNVTTSTDEQPLSMPLLVMLTVIYAFIFIAGILGNLITCIVISRNKFMHTATNFYLFNLAVSDLILLMSGVPPELYSVWSPTSYPFGDVPCVMQSVLSETAANATVLTITAFTVERYIAICHPFRQHTMSKLSRAIKFIFAIWFTAFFLALPQAMQYAVVSQEDQIFCTMNNGFVVHVFAVSGFIFFGGPMTAICVLYVLIGLKLKRSRLLQSLPRRSYDVNRGISAQTRVIRMLVAVAVTFFICWAPFHTQRLMAVYGSTANVTSETFKKVYVILNYTSGVLYFLSTCINPLLYNIMSHKFRQAFKVTLARRFELVPSGQYARVYHNYSALLRRNGPAGGSMRLNTTVNNNALEQYSSCRLVQMHYRDPNHHLSLQDSIRTTTTTLNSACGSGNTSCLSNSGTGGTNSCRSSTHRNRVSLGSQSTLLTSLSRPDVFATTTPNAASSTPCRSNGTDHRILQTQISQLSSLGDANSLLETDVVSGSIYYPSSNGAPYRRSLVTNNNRRAASLKEHHAVDGNRDWNDECQCKEAGDATIRKQAMRPYTSQKLVSASMIAATKPISPDESLAELSIMQSRPQRTRLKLSRIISHRDRDQLPISPSNANVEVLCVHQRNPNKPISTATTTLVNVDAKRQKTLLKAKNKNRNHRTFADRFRWLRRKKKQTPIAVTPTKDCYDGQEPSSSTSSATAPESALMQNSTKLTSTVPPAQTAAAPPLTTATAAKVILKLAENGSESTASPYECNNSSSGNTSNGYTCNCSNSNTSASINNKLRYGTKEIL